MKREILELYKRGAPELTEDERGYLRGLCPFCGGDGFMAGGLTKASTGERVDDFLCLDCDRQGSPEEFVQALREISTPTAGIEERETSRGMSEFGTSEGQEVPGDSPEAEEEGAESEDLKPDVSSDARMLEEILPFLRLELSVRELQIFIYLRFRGDKISAKEISEILEIPEKNVHRPLAGLVKKGLIYSEGTPRLYLAIEDNRLRDRFKRVVHPRK